jgi:hypothetical protein
MFKHFNLKDIRDHWRSNMCEWGFEAPGERITLRMKWITLVGVLREHIGAAICEWRGHNYECETFPWLAESGGEDLHCVRCGIGFRAWHN